MPFSPARSRQSPDADVACVMREIAEQLDESARSRIAQSRDEAVNALIAQTLGSHEDHALASALAESLWAA